LSSLNETSAITQASGITRGSLRPLPPSAGLVQGRVASQVGFAPPLPPSAPSYPVPLPPPLPPVASEVMFVAPALPVAEFHPTLVTSGVMRPSQRR
jgi:hypothetical protein